ncbi:uncharacterized protein LOC125236821 [Leguminivora glycinivorella]|uniref:uncharacterized protein LOC125236821 n=1 Tax=Leguminivora glycinivorella TaxID=1035111 RepID=UPI00200DA3DD|nr:uncharacterized protein LOC125236821 [Leguminivora glycinivorella]
MAGVMICLWSLLVLAISTSNGQDISATGNEVNQEVDKVIEDEITSKLSKDLAQSIEKKFLVDLEKSVNMVLLKIQMLLQNGTTHILERLSDLQGQLEEIRKSTGTELDTCLKERENETAQLAEKAMHQMVVCGYALIGHNPTQAVGAVINMKNMIKNRLQPVRTQKKDIDELLKACGHEHDSLKKVIKCVIAKSPAVKAAMMDVTSQMMQGVVELTKVLAHGAMHEACLIEVIKTVEDEAFNLVGNVRNCAFGNYTEEANKFIEENNATVLDIPTKKSRKIKVDPNKKEVVEMKQLIRRMLSEANVNDLDKRFKKKLKKLQEDLGSAEADPNTTAKPNVTLNESNADLNSTSFVSTISNDI